MVSRTHGDGVAVGTPVRVVVPRRARVLALLAAPGVCLALLDVSARHEQIAAWPRATLLEYAATLLLGGVLWGALVQAAAGRRAWPARMLLVAAAAMAVGAQLYFFGRYHAYMNPRAVLVGTSMMPSVGQQLWIDRASFLRALLPPVAASLLLLVARRRLAATGD